MFPGWRAVTDYGGVTQLAPDAVTRMHSEAHGDQWFFLEYERSAKRLDTIERKLEPYLILADSRPPVLVPLLVVCQEPEAEEIFWRVGGHLPMYTTNYPEATRGVLVGEKTVWRRNGQPAALHLHENLDIL